MSILLGLLAACGYGLQNTLMARFYRQMDTLSAFTYRGLSLGISMACLLLFVDFSSVHFSLLAVPVVCAASFAAIGNWSGALAYRSLPIGVAVALISSFLALGSLAVSYLLFREQLNIFQLGCVVCLILCILCFGFLKNNRATNFNLDIKRGLVFSFLSGLFLSFAFVVVMNLSRRADPFLVAYLWEASIGFVGLALSGARKISFGSGLTAISAKDFLKILLASSPTVIATASSMIAVRYGFVAIVTATLSTSMIISAIFAQMLFKEKLSSRHWLLVLLLCSVLFALHLGG